MLIFCFLFSIKGIKVKLNKSDRLDGRYSGVAPQKIESSFKKAWLREAQR